MRIDVLEVGAIGDGVCLNTDVIQRAVDDCFEAGGGVVYFPPGAFLSGSIELKTNVGLYLEAGAVLLASIQKSDYNSDLKVDNFSVHPEFNNEHLIFAKNAENLFIKGEGQINGNGSSYFSGELIEGLNHFKRPEWRPERLIAFIKCKLVRLQDFSLEDTPSWGIWTLASSNIFIDNLKIENNLQGSNTDGIDIDSSQNVTVSNCHISAGDDCVSLKTSSVLLEKPLPTENVIIHDCVFHSTTCGIRVGFEGDCGIHRCQFHHLIITGRTGINITSPIYPSLDIYKGPNITNIKIDQIQMDVEIPFFFYISDGVTQPFGISSIQISNVQAFCRRGSFFGGTKKNPIRDLTFLNLSLTLVGEMKDDFTEKVPDPYRIWGYLTKSGENAKSGLPYALFFRNIKGLKLRDIQVDRTLSSGFWLESICLDRVASVSVIRAFDENFEEAKDAEEVQVKTLL